MFQIITAWNFVCPHIDIQESIKNIKLRGYDSETFLTGEFRIKIANEELKPLSVGNIADILCSTKRDLYFTKGKNKPHGIRSRTTWGRIGGEVVEKFAFDLFNKFPTRKNIGKYSTVIKKLDIMSNRFRNKNSKDFISLSKLKSTSEEEPDWLLKLLNYNGRVELGLKLLHKNLLRKKSEIDLNNLKINQNDLLVINPNPKEIGINRGVKPDFLIEKYCVVGDIKSGIGGFQERYLLTCAGYALAYENENGKGHNINFGIVYFFPTRHGSRFVKPISFSQVYIFPIDDNLRQYFMDVRDDAYKIISSDSIPSFPAKEHRLHCSSYCQFYEKCLKDGLKL